MMWPAILLFLCTPYLTAAEEPTYPPVPMLGSQLRELSSTHTGRDYHLYVGLPGGYAESTEAYPVLYLLDGQWDFKMLMSIYGGLRYDMFVPDMIIVGITYGGEHPDYDALRAIDYTPTQEEGREGTGEAPKFLAFLKEELIPFIEENYRADPDDRALGGSSFGGLFSLYALFHEPDLFQRHICTSPAASWDDDISFRYEQDYFAKRKDLPVRLFLSAGGLEHPQWMVEPMQRMAKQLETRHYKGLQLTSMVVAGERHSGVKPEAFNRGLRAVFGKRAIEISASLLDAYAGTYQSGEGEQAQQVVFVREGQQLMQKEEEGPIVRDELLADSDSTFFFRSTPAEITFHWGADRKVTGATLHMAWGDQPLEKLD